MRKRITSVWAARHVYHVAFAEDTLDIDYADTDTLRAQERERRKADGKPFPEFVEEWLQQKPRDVIIRSYGPLPGGH